MNIFGSRKSMALAVIGMALLVAPLLLSAADALGPRLVLPTEHYDFGKVPQGQPVEHLFELRNGGDEPLIIERVRTS